MGGTILSQGHNLSNDDGNGFLTGPGDIISTDPLLGPLQDNGGPTQTLALLPGSPAVDAGDNTDVPDFDQRGPDFLRIVGGTIDIGAFEAQIGAATHFAITAPTEVTSGTPFDVIVAALDAYGHIAAGYLGTVTFSSTDTDPSVVLPANYAFTADDHGVHTFMGGFTLETVGNQTLTATDTADNTLTGSATVTVQPGQIAPPGARVRRSVAASVNSDLNPTKNLLRDQEIAADAIFTLFSDAASGSWPFLHRCKYEETSGDGMLQRLGPMALAK